MKRPVPSINEQATESTEEWEREVGKGKLEKGSRSFPLPLQLKTLPMRMTKYEESKR